MEDRKRKRIYIFCIVLFLLGGGLFFYNVVKSFTGLGSTLSEYTFPGSHSVRLEKKGLYSIYHQYESAFDEAKTSGDSVGEGSIVVYLRKASDAENVELKVPDSQKRYSYMGKRGVKIFEFENPGPTAYLIESFSSATSQLSQYTLVLERGFEITRLKGILISQAFLLVPTLFAIILFMRTYIRS
ncbi:MAG: hypothetical protein OXC39_00140 [Candidatus Dadabacteria bacterium]|nr:hypothetical protein [Candidatus Dadabacteria bacterium]